MRHKILVLIIICFSTGALAGESASLSSKAENKVDMACPYKATANRKENKGAYGYKTKGARKAVSATKATN